MAEIHELFCANIHVLSISKDIKVCINIYISVAERWCWLIPMWIDAVLATLALLQSNQSLIRVRCWVDDDSFVDRIPTGL